MSQDEIKSVPERSVQRNVVLHEPKVTIRYTEDGTVEVLLDDWVYVRINYNYRYTDNASRTWLAKEIVRLLQHNSDYATGRNIG